MRTAAISCSGGSSLSTKPLAPALQRLVDVLVEVERREDQDARARRRRRGCAASPRGRRARACGCPSARRSGWKRAALCDRLEPVARLGDDLDVRLAARAACGSRRGPSTGRRRRGRGCSCARTRRAAGGCVSDEAAAGRGARGHLAAVDLDALADADEPVAERRRSARAPPPSSRTSICSSSARVADDDVGVAGARVLERVGQALLDDPVGGEVDRARAARPGSPSTCSSHRQAGAADLARAARRGRRARAAARARRPRPRARIAPSRRRISASAVRPVCSTPLQRLARPRASSSGSRCRTAPTCSTITLTAWATMSCSSRAIRARSSATAMRAAASRSRSAWRARSSAASACAARSRSAKPAEPGDREQRRDEDEVAGRVRRGRCRR